jgi:D-alanine-D-alanine ligase-like ATP-grasp enzyme
MLIEVVAKGNDYRVVVLDEEVISAYQRLYLGIVGDGKSSVFDLLLAKQKQFEADGRDTVLEINDYRLINNLKRKGLNFESVLASGEKLQLLDNANLSTGGEAVDVSETIHPDFQQLSVDITKKMGLRICGVDIFADDLTKSMAEQQFPYSIIEINGAPGIDNYANSGEAQKENVKDLYRKIIKSLGQ